MEKYNRQWKLSPELKIDYEKLYEEVRTHLNDWEAKLIWCLRRLPKGTTAEFYFTARKLYNAYQAKLNLSKFLE